MNRPSWRIILRYGSAVAFVLAVLFLMWNTRILIMRSVQSHLDSAGYHNHGQWKESQQYAEERRQTMPNLANLGWGDEDKQCECPDSNSDNNNDKVEEKEIAEKDFGDNEIKTCQPVTKVAFAKTHKTGSSTVQNILLRYGVKHDLTFAMPPNSWMFHIIDAFDADQVLLGPWRHLEFDIFAFHCRWNYDEVHRILPDAKFMTILREPLATFESNYVYMGAQNARKADLNEFAERFAAKGEKRNPKAYVGQNNLLWDLGVDAKQLDNMDVAEAKIKEVEEKFEMVMIMERFEESLVLLADAFCWPLEEVTYIKQNERVAEIRNVPTEKTKEIMRKWLRGDYKLYDHFMEVFERKIDAYGRERMAEDVKRLQTMNEHIKNECITKVVQPGDDIKKTGLNSVYTFETDKTKPWCNPYTRRETDYCKMIRTHQTHKVEDMRLRGELPDIP